ncbi:hypothetical protein PATSB16_28760 [Pandoraea thiooxydans]|nr:hypothetical protein PATSB16_28760 [Pandoraea thiooxydans]
MCDARRDAEAVWPAGPSLPARERRYFHRKRFEGVALQPQPIPCAEAIHAGKWWPETPAA